MALVLRMIAAALLVIVLGCYDGDTCRVDVLGWPPIAGQNIPVRIAGIDTPEIRGKCEREKALAIEARDLTRSLVLGAARVTLENVRRGKYYRLLATVRADGEDVADRLMDAGLARPYSGGARESWCTGGSNAEVSE